VDTLGVKFRIEIFDCLYFLEAKILT